MFYAKTQEKLQTGRTLRDAYIDIRRCGLTIIRLARPNNFDSLFIGASQPFEFGMSDPSLHRSSRPRSSSTNRRSRSRMPSASAYMVAAAAAAAASFFLLWWMLQGDENPWIPAGLAAVVVMLVAVSARQIVMRRAFARFVLEQNDARQGRRRGSQASTVANLHSASLQNAALRELQKQSAQADASESAPEAHREVYQLCIDYLLSAEEVLRTAGLSTESRVALRAGQERVRALQKHHLLTWARDESRALTREAQQRARLHEKIETANRALDCIDSALKVYPEEEELRQSAGAVHEFITSSRVAHWIELAERAVFKGYYRRAIDCYRDALFFLTRDKPAPDREAAAERITREIDLLRARLATQTGVDSAPERKATKPRRSL